MDSTEANFSANQNLQKFQEWLSQFQLSDSSVQTYMFSVKVFLREIKEINQESMNRFFKKYSRPKYREAAKHFLKFLGWKEVSAYTFADPAGKTIELIKTKQPERKPREEPRREELKNLVEMVIPKIANQDVIWMLRLFYHTGARANDLLKIRLNDVSVEKGIIFMQTKGGQFRDAAVRSDVLQEFRDYLVNSGRLGTERCFFKDSKDTNSAYRIFRHHIYSLPVEEKSKRLLLHTHNFRRADINEILDKTGGDVIAAKEAIGHKRLETTMRYVAEWQRKKKKLEGEKVLQE